VNAGYAWDHTPNDLGAISCYWLGMFERALAHAKVALEKSPNDRRLQNNLLMIEEKTKRSRVHVR
jgi:hypothetical protein